MLASFVFLNPMTMVVGGALVASPIIIHLINRMRFKRIRWAAMEFLLKAQKRTRRRMIIEQLLLLLLRILLVLAVAVLLARLIEQKDDPAEAENPLKQKDPPPITKHIVILDDSASMADRYRQNAGPEQGREIQPYVKARTVVNKGIIDAVRDDNKNPHEFIFLRTCSPETPRDFDLLTSDSAERIERYLIDEYKPTDFHDDLPATLAAAKSICDQAEKRNLVIHIVSDFRAGDWNESTRDQLGGFFAHFDKAKVQIKLHDVGSPRRESGKELPVNENLAIIDFRPDTRLAIKDQPIDFFVTIANYGESVKQNVRVNLRVNNEERLDGSINFKFIPRQSVITERVTFSLTRTAPKDAKDLAEHARFDGFNLVSAHLENQDSGLAVDDLRYAVVEVREKLGILLIDNGTGTRTLVREYGRDEYLINRDSEAYFLWKLFRDNSNSFNVSVRTAAELEKLNLAPYSAVVLCNVPLLTPPAVQKLESFLGNGGGVGFIMGPAIEQVDFYNNVLWKQGAGMFPAPLKEIANYRADLAVLDKIMTAERNSPYKKLVVRNEMRRHPAMEKLYSDSRSSGDILDTKFENAFYGVSFPHYAVVDRARHAPGANTQTLLYLANNRSIADYERQTRDLLKRLRDRIDEAARRAAIQAQIDAATDEARKDSLKLQLEQVKDEAEKFAKYAPLLRQYASEIGNTVGKYDNGVFRLAAWLDTLLREPGDPARMTPSLLEFWQLPEVAELKQEFLKLEDLVKYGDPFYFAKQHRKGRVLAFMGGVGVTGERGRYWSSLNQEIGQRYFPPLMKDSLQHYLCSGVSQSISASEVALPVASVAGGLAAAAVESVVSDFYPTLGKPFLFELEGEYQPAVDVVRLINNERPAVGEAKVSFEPVALKNKPQVVEGPMVWRFDEATKPGVYLFEFVPKASEGGQTDLRALSCNFDTTRESNLARARGDEVLTISGAPKFEDDAGEIKRVSKETVRTSEQESDLGYSKSHWLFLGLLVLLILEQAWAVRLSFHVRDNANLRLPQGFTRGTMISG
jgi:hypothetical protein